MKALLTSAFWLFVLAPTLAVAGPKFANTPTELGTLKAGQPFSIDLRTLLSDPGTPPLNWFASTNLPSWLTLDSANNRLSGTPAGKDVGQYQFSLSVTDSSGEGGDINHPTRIAVTSPPVWATEEIDLGIANEDYPFEFDLTTVVTDQTGGPLTFTATGLPNWLKLNGSTLSGTPRRQDVGDYEDIEITATSPGGSAAAWAYGEVLITLKKPKWTAKKITLPENPLEDQPYTRDLSEFVENPEGFPLTFSIVSQTPPPWIKIGKTSATIYGTPGAKNVGPESLTVSLSTQIDGKAFTTAATFSFTVIHVNHPPSWVANPIRLPAGYTEVAYRQPLAGSASDPDVGDTLTYTLVPGSGPAWAKIDPKSGNFYGTPGVGDAGEFEWEAVVEDQDGAQAKTTLLLDIIQSNAPPVWTAANLPDGFEGVGYNVDLSAPQYVTDPDDDELTFTLLSAPAFVSLSSQGILSAAPKRAHVGSHTVRVRVSDNISGSADRQWTLTIQSVNQPPRWTLNPIRITVNEDAPMRETVSQYATDPDGDDLTFALSAPQPWVALSQDGVFTGKPGAVQVGDNPFTLTVTDPDGLSASTRVIIEVLHVNKAPYWTQSPIALPNGKEKQPYAESLMGFAKDPDEDVLTFERISGPLWATISPSGMVSGIPERGDVGVNTFRVRVLDPALDYAEVTVQIRIEKVNRKPRWRQNPILMGDAFEQQNYQFDISRYAVDDDNDRLTFALDSGPSWLSVSKAGLVSGTPPSSAVGDFEAFFIVTDAPGESARTRGMGQVLDVNRSPVISSNIPTFSVKERSVARYALAPHVKDPDGDTLNYVLEAPAPWISLTSTGDLILTRPGFKNIRTHRFAFKVDDGEIAVHGTLTVEVLRDARPPQWNDPVRFEAKTNEPFNESLKAYAKDLDGIALTFTKSKGPAWLAVNSNGTLTGTPRNNDTGENVFVVQACNDKLCADGGVIVKVVPGTQIESFAIDTPSSGARVDNVWVVDNSQPCSNLINSLRYNIRYYFEALDRAGIHHAGVYLSADAHRFGGLPIRAKDQARVFRWKDGNVVDDFKRRMSLGYSSGHCGNCFNSPIWSQHLFFNKAPSLSDVFQNGYLEAGVPLEVLYVTRQRDHYRWYAQHDPEFKPYTADNFATRFIDESAQWDKPLRVSAIAPECPSLVEMSGVKGAAGPADSYRKVVRATGGQYFATGCHYPLKQHLEAYAEQVIFRARVGANRRFSLAQPPIELGSIRVWLGEKSLTGNTGSDTDQWRFHPGTNEIEIFWETVSPSEIRPGAKIRVEYRVS